MTNPMTGKIIKALQQKKYRQETKKFLVEGSKNVAELLQSTYPIDNLYVTAEFKVTYKEILGKHKIQPQLVDANELKAFGSLEHNDGALAIARQKDAKIPKCTEGITIVLDDIRDPGNLGTIIRIADWYGIRDIVCSNSCVDWHNPKVISASMGSFTRVNGYYTELPAFLKQQKAPILGGFMDGKSTHTYKFPTSGILVIGSESHGISKEVAKCITEKITIPKIGGAESLNAGVATAVILDNWLKTA
ncbi:MAG: RNA methyltransferase [Candidatus Pacebacteria bacterium]|nr:RNA methyltransferase [Candidatus Paceibacterota bacterium]